MKIGYFDCFSGAAGDMIMGALVHAGAPLEAINGAIGKLSMPGVTVTRTAVVRRSIAASKASVVFPHEHHSHRSFADVRAMLERSELEDAVRDRSLSIFRRLAEAEGKVHGRAPEEVTFHETGAVDAIADIVGAAAGVEALRLEHLFVSAFGIGYGTVECAHGKLPVPAPATVELLKGFETVRTGVRGELTTPTGAAILTTLAEQADPPPFVCESVGYGAGTADREGLPNVVRLQVGRTAGDSAETDFAWVLETNVDDMPPELCGYLFDRLLAAGALDVAIHPVQMKKSRPGIQISCLAPVGLEAALQELLFRETPTLGIRKHPVQRVKLAREHRTVRTPYGEVRVKIGRLRGEIVTLAPEYEDCRRLAQSAGVPLREVYAEAARLGRART